MRQVPSIKTLFTIKLFRLIVQIVEIHDVEIPFQQIDRSFELFVLHVLVLAENLVIGLNRGQNVQGTEVRQSSLLLIQNYLTQTLINYNLLFINLLCTISVANGNQTISFQ